MPANWGLATRVVLAAAALFAILLAIVLLSYDQAIDERRHAEVDNAVAMGQAIATVFDGFAQDLETSTLALAIALASQNDPLDQQSVGPTLGVLAKEYGMLRSLFMTDARGRVIAASTGEGIGTDLATRPYMQTLMGGAQVVWGPGVAGIQTGEVTVTFARSVRRPDGAIRGYLVAAFYPPRLIERLQGRIPADADLTLVDGTGLVLHSTQQPNLDFEQRDLSRSPRPTMLLAGGAARIDGEAGFFGDERRFGVVVPVPRTGWAVAFTRPLAPLEEALQARFVQQAGGITIAVLLVGAILALATKRIARPLAELADAAGAVARGERPAMPAGDSSVEVGALADAMAHMSEAVAEREDRLRRQAAALESAIRGGDEFLAMVSHDLKNPLTTIRASAEVVLRALQRGVNPNDERLTRALAAIDRAAGKAAAQIDGLLDMARLQSGQSLELARHSTDLVALVRDAAAEYQQTTERHQIEVTSTEDQLIGEWDGPRLERAIGNLLSNALKYSPGGGDVTVKIQREQQNGGWAAVSVTDRGIGIPADALPHVFERFYRSDNVVGRIEGTGLGLSGVRYVIEEHGGTVEVASVEGHGSTFTLRLPMRAPASESARRKAKPGSA